MLVVKGYITLLMLKVKYYRNELPYPQLLMACSASQSVSQSAHSQRPGSDPPEFNTTISFGQSCEKGLLAHGQHYQPPDFMVVLYSFSSAAKGFFTYFS